MNSEHSSHLDFFFVKSTFPPKARDMGVGLASFPNGCPYVVPHYSDGLFS